jgi:hypothetical protein
VSPHHQAAQTFQFRQNTDGRYCLEKGGAGTTPSSISADSPAAWLQAALAKAPDHQLDFATILKLAIDRDLSRRHVFRLINQELEAGRLHRVGVGLYKALVPA